MDIFSGRLSGLTVLFSILLSASFGLQAEAQDSLISEVKEKTPGEKQLDALLKIHRSGVPEDFSLKYDKKIKTFREHIKETTRMLEQRAAINLHRDAIDVFGKSAWVAEQCTPKAFPVCSGTQLLQDLDVMAGKPGSDTIYLASKLELARSTFGKVSAALLLAQPESDVSVLLQRQEAIRALSVAIEKQEKLAAIYADLAVRERYMLPVLNADRAFENRNFNLGLLILEIPGIRKLQKNPWVATVNETYRTTIGSILWFFMISYASYKLAAYSAYSLKNGTTGADSTGEYLSKKSASQITDPQTWMATWDAKAAFSLFPDNPYVHGIVAAAMSGLCVWWAYHQLDWIRGGFLSRKLRWYGLAQVSSGYGLMRRVYEETVNIPEIRALPDCAPVFDFFEKTIKEDKELAELCSLFEGFPLDLSAGSSLWLGHVERAYELLKTKNVLLADLAVGVGRVEVYLGLAQKMSQPADTKNGYIFPTYAAADELPVYQADGLWNPFLAADVAVPSSISLGGAGKVRNYLVTGLNAGGKSTLLKAVALGALMAQTAGIVPAKSCHISVFSVIETYLNISDDVAQGHSLFKKEVMRAAELLKRAADAQSKPVLFIFDEMFSGTTPHEGVSCAYSVADYIAKTPNILSCIATHFMYVTQLSQYHDSVANKCVRIDHAADGSGYTRTYRLHDGIADQHVALDMLGEEGVDGEIVDRAKDILKDITTNGLHA